MNTNTLFYRVFSCLCAVILAGLVVSRSASGQVHKQWTIIPMELASGQSTYVSDFALGQEGVPWVALSTPHHTICYWEDGTWHKLAGNFRTGMYLARLYTSPTGKIYLSQSGKESYVSPPSNLKEHFGGLYHLEKGKATYVTEYYYEAAHYYPNLYFDKKDRIWNWGNRFVAKFEDGKWERVEASLGSCWIIEDNKGNLFFIGKKTISYYKDGTFKTDIKMADIPLKTRGRAFKCCLWGEDKVLFIDYGNKGVEVFDLNTFEFDENIFRETSLFESSLYDLFRDRHGNAWILASNSTKAKSYFYIKVSAQDGTVEEILSTAVIQWDNHRNTQHPESVLCAADGAIYFGPPGDGVYIFRDGQVSHIGWKQGLAINDVDWVREGKDDSIWIASRRTGIAVYDPEGVQDEGPASQFVNTWVEYPLANRAFINDFEGSIWCCLKDKPKTVSKWNGEDWEHFETNADIAKVSAFLVDDLNRLHLRMSDYPSGVYRLWSGRVDHFKNMQEMLEDSVRTGSREFRSSPSYSILPTIVTNDREIWFALPRYSYFHHFDGVQWHQFNLSGDIDNIFKWKNNSILIKANQKFFRVDKGQLIEFTNRQTENKEYLLGEHGLQLFDREIYQANRDKLFPMRKTYKGIYLFDNVDDFLNFKENDIPRTAVKFSKYIDRIWLADGGFWFHSDNLPTLSRYYQGLMLKVDLATTPIGSTLSAFHCDVYDDQSGNLWLRHRDKVFKIKRGLLNTIITTPKKIIFELRKIRIEFKGLSDNKESDKLKYVWRLDDSGWSQPTKKNFVELYFNESGFHNFKVMSVGEMGNLDTTAATLKLNIVILTPEVKIVSIPSRVLEVPVVIEYKVVKRQEGSRLSFQWRVDSGEWHNTSDTKVILWSLEDGKHVFEVRAIEDNKYVQPKPAKAEFVLKTDYKKIILREIERLKSDSYAEREKAAAALISIGERCLPYLRKELEQATADTEWWFKNVIWQIEH